MFRRHDAWMPAAVIGLGIMVIACGEGKLDSSTPPGEPMNLLLITLDTLRADRLGCYGYPKATSPVMDALASRSLLFENAIAQSAVTPVSHASIMTGLNPYRHQLRSMHGGRDYALPEDRLTLAELMAANGRTTAAFISAFTASKHFGLQQGFAFWDEEFSSAVGRNVLTQRGFVNTGRAQRRADETTDRALSWLRQHGEEPFFAWIHYFDVHDPLILPPQEYLAEFPARSGSRRDRLLAIYDAEILYVDAQVGRILELLDRRDLRDKTLIAILADHGEGLGDHGWWGHSLLYQEQLRVPFLLSAPGRGWSGRVTGLVRTVDLLPTLVDLMDLQCPQGPCDFDGESLRLMIEKSPSGSRIAYSESLNDLSAYQESPLKNDTLYSVNDGRWKLIARYERGEKRPSLMFDLVTDPTESLNLIRQRPAVEKRLSTYLEELDAVVGEQATAPLEGEARERLRALGYVK
jgi:arylsulfatase A-like enzyme